MSKGRRGQRGDPIGGRLLEEDMATLPEQLKDVSIKEYDIPKRPAPGKQGRQIILKSNFYEVKHFPDQVIHYDVAITQGKMSDKFPKDLNRSIIEELVKVNKNIFKRRPVYDRKKSLYSMDELPFESREFTVVLMEDERMRTFQVNIQFAAKINMRALHQAVEGRQRLLTQEPIVVLDTIMHYAATKRKKALGSRFFTSDGAIAISMGREIWRGYYQSARQGWERVLLNINMASSLFLRAMRVIDYLYEITMYDVSKHKGVLSERNRIKFKREIKSMLHIEESYVYLEYNKNLRQQ